MICNLFRAIHLPKFIPHPEYFMSPSIQRFENDPVYAPPQPTLFLYRHFLQIISSCPLGLSFDHPDALNESSKVYLLSI